MTNQFKISHIAGTFLIDASGAFLNGAGLAKIEDKNYNIVKTLSDGVNERGYSYKVAYVSSQASRRWLRDTTNEEAGWPPSKLRALQKNPRGNTEKLGGEFNPIDFPEDDIFGYMRTKGKDEDKGNKGNKKGKKGKPEAEASTTTTLTAAVAEKKTGETGQEEEEEEEDNENEEEGESGSSEVRGIFRTSPLSTSILMGLRKTGWEGIDQAYVHLTEGSSQPYRTQFMNTPLQGIFCLNYKRLGVFTNIGDRMELSDEMIKRYLAENKIHLLEEESQRAEYHSLEKTDKQKNTFKQKKKHGQVYEIINAAEARKERASELIKALAVLRGGSKQAAFATDVSPKVLILAGLTCGNPIFNNLFEDRSNSNERGKTVAINVNALKEIARDYKDRICTPVFIGIRTGYIQNESEVKSLASNNNTESGIKFVVTTPIHAANKMAQGWRMTAI